MGYIYPFWCSVPSNMNACLLLKAVDNGLQKSNAVFAFIVN